MREKVRVGIIGLGFGAQVHLPAFQSLTNVQVVAIADAGSGRANRVAAEKRELRRFNDWRRVIELPDIDAVSVATPPETQVEIVCAALAAGKHVLCEKPFGKSVSDAVTMFQAAQKSHLVNAVVFQFRMEPGIAELKRQVERGRIGRVIRIDVTWLTSGRWADSALYSWQNDAERGGGVLNSFGTHIIDYIEWICDSSVSRVMGLSGILRARRKDKNGEEHAVTAEESCDVLCVLANDAIASLRFSNYYPVALGHRVEVYGEKGRLVYIHEPPFIPGEARLVVETKSTRLAEIPVRKLRPLKSLDTRTLPFRELARRFVGAVTGQTNCYLPDFAQGLRIQKVVQSVRDSLTQRREILI